MSFFTKTRSEVQVQVYIKFKREKEL